MNSDELPVVIVVPTRNQLVTDVFNRRGRDLKLLARTLVDTEDEAEEVVQEAFARLVASFKRLDAGKAEQYVTVSVLNLARSRLRRRRTVRDRAGAVINRHVVESRGLDADTADHAELARVRAAVRDLPRRQQECVVLRYFSDMGDAQIGDLLGITPGAVKQHLTRARANLATVLRVETEERP